MLQAYALKRSMYHLRGREALQQSRRLRWALNRSWLSHVPDDNLCIPKILLALMLIIDIDVNFEPWLINCQVSDVL